MRLFFKKNITNCNKNYNSYLLRINKDKKRRGKEISRSLVGLSNAGYLIQLEVEPTNILSSPFQTPILLSCSTLIFGY